MTLGAARKTAALPVPAYKEAGQGRDGASPTLVFLHGIGGNKDSFDDQTPAFAAAWRVLSWDMPGYGESALDGEMTFALLADSLAAMLDAAGVERAVICGHSMGGMVAQEFAARHPDRAAALILSATSPAFGSKDGRFQAEFLTARLAPLDRGLTPADIAGEVVGAMFGNRVDAAVRDRIAASLAALSAEAYRAALQCIVTFDRRGDLGRIACPTLVLAAERDHLAPPAMMERMAAAIPNATYRCLAGVGHLANFEDPPSFNGALAGFLDTIDKGGIST